MLERSLDSIQNWLNLNIMIEKQPITQYPKDVINNQGVEIFDLIQYLTNKSLNFKMKVDPNVKRI